MTVEIIRHGATPGNIERRYIGSTDEPLADALAIFPRADAADIRRVYISPMLRTRMTAERLFPSAELIEADGLREMDFGDFEGRNADEMENDAAYREWVDGMCEGRCPNGEMKAEFIERTCAAFEKIGRSASERGEERIVIVAHGGTAMSVMSRYAEEKLDYYAWSVKNLGGWRAELCFDNDGISLRGCVKI